MRVSRIANLPLLLAVALCLLAVPCDAQTNTGAAVVQNAPATTQPLSAETVARTATIQEEAEALGSRPVTGGTASPRRLANDPAAATNANGQPAARPSSSLDFTRVATALAIVVGLIVAARLLFKKFFVGANAPAASRTIKVIGRTSLAPRQQVLLIQVGGRVVVVGESNGNLSTLAQIEDPDEVARLVGQLQEEQISRAASFGGLFGRMQRKYEEGDAVADPNAPVTLPDTSAHAPRTQAAALEEEHQISQAKSELSGLVDKVRALRSQMGQ